MAGKIYTIAWFTFLENLYNRSLYVGGAVVALALVMAQFLDALTIIESREFQHAFLGVFLRLSGVLLMSVMIVTGMRRELDEKRLELTLAFAISRSAYLTGKFLGYGLIAGIVVMVLTVPLWFTVPASQVLVWGLSAWCELLIVSMLALTCALTFNQVTGALLALFATYLLARVMHALQAMGHGVFFSDATIADSLINHLLDAIAFVLPGLNYFANTDWLVYHTAQLSSLLPVVGQTVIYLSLLAAVALFDLYRKNF